MNQHTAQAPVLERPLTERERAAVIARIQALVDYWGITTQELKAPLPRAALNPVAAEAIVKYRHPKSGETWDGVGPHPEWLRLALLREGYRVEELRPDYQQQQMEQQASAH
jgi:DNA-binding protein H-NS